MKKAGVAILGLGVVGTGTYRILTEKREYFKDTQGLDLTVEAVLEPRREHALKVGVPEETICSNLSEVVGNPAVDIVVECIGGEEPALSFLKTALLNGKTCVTSNKELFSKHWYELMACAEKGEANLFFEASCMGGVPVIRVLTEGMQANRVQKICGIINGTTNYILTRMEEGMRFEDALSEAQRLGYAEANPKADVEGYDAAYKLSILSRLVYFCKITPDDVDRQGITEIEREDVAYAKSLGYAIKLLAVGKRTERGLELRVQPALVPNTHPIAGIKDCFNAVSIFGDSVGEVLLSGRGAGAEPTGSAIVSDVITAAKHPERNYPRFFTEDKQEKLSSEITCGHYLRFTEIAEGAVAKIAAALSRQGVVIKKMESRDGNLLVITEEGAESALKKALRKLEGEATLCAFYRVEEPGEPAGFLS